MSGYSTVPISSICNIVMGTSPKGTTYNYHGQGLPLLNGPTEFGLSHPSCTIFTDDPKKECEPGDLIFCVRGSTTGRMNWADKKYALGRGVCAIRGKNEGLTYFIRYALEFSLPRLLQLATGATFPNLTKDSLHNFETPYLSNYLEIVKVLKRYDDLIENNWRRIKLLEQAVRLLFNEWFINYNFPGHENVKAIDGGLESWDVVKVTDIIHINPKEHVEKGNTIRYVPMSSLSQEGMSIDITQGEYRKKATNVKFRNDDTLLARITPCLENGKTAFVNILKEYEVACGSTEFIVLRGEQVSPYFVYCLSRTHRFREKAIKSMVGSSGRQRVQITCFEDFKVLLPPTPLLDKFNQFASKYFEQISNLQQQNKLLIETRDILLPRLMNGEISV